MTVSADEAMSAEVRVMFGDNIVGSAGDTTVRRIVLRRDGSDTLLAVKGKIAVGLNLVGCIDKAPHPPDRPSAHRRRLAAQ